MYRSTSFRSTLNTSYIRGLGMCKVCTEAVHSEALFTRVTEVWACVKYVPKQNTSYIRGLGMCKACTEAVHSEALWTRVTSEVWAVQSMYRSSSFRSTLNTSYIRGLGMCKVCTEAVHSVALWTLNTSYIRGLGMSKVCTEAVPSVALWTQVTSEVWACVKNGPKQFIPKDFEHELHQRFGHV